jgi:DNA-directed RNA polymerase III subunit RPC4
MLTIITDRKNNPNRGYSGFGAGSGSRAVRVKNEGDGQGGSNYRSGGGGSGGGGGSSIKREDGDYMSSEDEEAADVPRKDIDAIEISSDEDESKPASRGPRGAVPVRIMWKEHKERTFGINTEASSVTSAKILAKAEATDKLLAAVVAEETSQKPRDIEITSSRKQFKGVWHDSKDSDIQAKTEPTSDDENMADAEQFSHSNVRVQVAEKPEPQSPDAERKPKPKLKSLTELVLQTEEDRAEWARFQANLRHIRTELGPNEIPEVDGSGDVAMADGAAANSKKKPSPRDGMVYLFQIPPLMPELLPPSIKSEPSDPQPAPPAPTQKSDPKIKLEKGGGFSDPSSTASSDKTRFGSGLVGKMCVHESGRTTLDWGGTSLELTPRNKVGFLQVVNMEIIPEAKKVVPKEGGDATSLGTIKGKFVVTPNWDAMLG